MDFGWLVCVGTYNLDQNDQTKPLPLHGLKFLEWHFQPFWLTGSGWIYPPVSYLTTSNPGTAISPSLPRYHKAFNLEHDSSDLALE